ncbi:MAG: beta-ketoacyl-[acyl-carrier-protein] synthase II, partial [Candidatus Omnitrophica bacterium CG12_big_fil_rev_8_21_14_0_65_45_16]
MKQVVVTGIGCLSPFGRGREIFAKGLQTGLDTARPLRKFDTQKFR